MDLDLTKIIKSVRSLTMVPDDGIEFTVTRAIRAIESELAGDFVECGTWLGGCSFANLLAQRAKFGKVIKPVWFFDSFEGLPSATEKDGPAAKRYQSEPDSDIYFDNCRASFDAVMNARKMFEFSDDEAILVRGWFEDSIPTVLNTLKQRRIALLRVDCDWYEPVLYTLSKLEPLVSDGATVIIDDYYAWDGCARATHEYLSRNDLCYRIKSLPSFNNAWFDKIQARTY